MADLRDPFDDLRRPSVPLVPRAGFRRVVVQPATRGVRNVVDRRSPGLGVDRGRVRWPRDGPSPRRSTPTARCSSSVRSSDGRPNASRSTVTSVTTRSTPLRRSGSWTTPSRRPSCPTTRSPTSRASCVRSLTPVDGSPMPNPRPTVADGRVVSTTKVCRCSSTARAATTRTRHRRERHRASSGWCSSGPMRRRRRRSTARCWVGRSPWRIRGVTTSTRCRVIGVFDEAAAFDRPVEPSATRVLQRRRLAAGVAPDRSARRQCRRARAGHGPVLHRGVHRRSGHDVRCHVRRARLRRPRRPNRDQRRSAPIGAPGSGGMPWRNG